MGQCQQSSKIKRTPTEGRVEILMEKSFFLVTEVIEGEVRFNQTISNGTLKVYVRGFETGWFLEQVVEN